MDIQITINVPSEPAAPRAASTTDATQGETLPSSPEVSGADHGDAPWFPAPPGHPAGTEEFSLNGSAPDVALSPPGIEELETDFAADAADIPPPEVLTVRHDASSDDGVPPGLEEIGPGSLPMSSDATDLAPPDPSVLEGAT